MSTLSELHKSSYTMAVDLYKNKTNCLHNVRSDILSYVLNGENPLTEEPRVIGPEFIGQRKVTLLSRDSTILDAGCGTGDNLKIMSELGFQYLTGIDIAPGMIEETSKAIKSATLITGDVFDLDEQKRYDLVFAQAFIHLFEKKDVLKVIQKLLDLSRQRFYFSTTLHDISSEGIEVKEGLESKDINRYRSRYTLDEILGKVREVVSRNMNVNFRYFLLTDPLNKLWINGVFERIDTKKMYDAEGVMVYRQLCSKEQIERLNDEVDSIRTTKPEPNTILRYEGEKVFDRIENFVSYCSDELRNVLTGEKVNEIVSTLFGEKGILLKDKLNFKMPGSKEFPPHQDAAAGWDRFANKHMTFALSFDKATHENGALHFTIGDHKKGLLTEKGTPFGEKLASTLKWELLATEPGDAIFFDSYVPHYSKPNLTDKSRKMSFITYIPAAAGDFSKGFFEEKRKKQPSIDSDNYKADLPRDAFGKLIIAKQN